MLFYVLSHFALILIISLMPLLFHGTAALVHDSTVVRSLDVAMVRGLRSDSPVGCKRTLLSNACLAALARDNVELVDAPVRRIVEDGVEMQDGTRHRVDAIVYGTGFAAKIGRAHV